MDSEEENKKVKINCPHCHEEFTLEDMEEVDCSDCGTTTLSILTRKCKDPNCENVYCKDCLSNLNEHGYCDDCQNVCCDGCNSDVDRGTEVLCQKCKKAEFCTDCAPKMVGEEGCTECVDDELKVECADCGTILKSKALLCKNFDECDNAYCKEHSEDSINSNGYCFDCQTLSCDSCGENINRGDEVTCPVCKEKNFCKDCAEKAIDPAVGCIECVSSDLTVVCDDCRSTILKSKAVLCKNFAECEAAFCKEHSTEKIDAKGYCENCNSFRCSHCGTHFDIDQAVKCQNSKCKGGELFCKQCSKLVIDNSGLCTDCSTKVVVTCANCDKQVFTEQTIKCENCDDHFCPSCTGNLTECSKCHRKVCSGCIDCFSECRKSICITCGDLDKHSILSDHKTEERGKIRKDTTVFKPKKDIREQEKENETKPKQKKPGIWAWIKENFF